MREAAKIRALAESRMRRAGEALGAAHALLREQFYEDSTSRSYYAMFHAASALLLIRGLGASKHKGVLSLFDRYFVKPGLVSKEMSTWIHEAFEARREADYAEVTVDPQATARAVLQRADDFVRDLRPVLDRLLNEVDTSSPTDS
jgi:uncharacterized protein (UPF0332 family)